MPGDDWAHRQIHFNPFAPNVSRTSSSGAWHINGSNALNQNDVQRQGRNYVPWQSYNDRSGRHAYQGNRYPRAVPQNQVTASGRSGNLNGNEWMDRRPPATPPYHTVPLGVRGLADQPGYDWSWYNNARDGHGNSYYRPPAR